MNEPTALEKYEIVKSLGKGATGETILVRHKALDVYRAVKIIHRQSLIAIPLEVSLLKALNHPGIPIIYDFEQDRDNCYIIMEYIEGPTLAEYMAGQTSIDYLQMLSYGIQLCDTLEYLHTRIHEPIVHLDLQPKNIILCGNQVKLIDFGNALGLTSTIFPKKTSFGTHGFSAPELYRLETPDIGADLYSFGKLMYYMLTGEIMYETSARMTSLCYERLSRLLPSPKLGEQLGETICKCLYPTPTLRYRDTRTLKVALEHLLRQLDGSVVQRPSDLVSSQTSLHIALCGATHGIGVTHVGLALTNSLNRRQKPAIYIDEQESQMLYRLKEADHMVRERSGIYTHGSCHMTFHSDLIEDPDTKDYPIQIHDYGLCCAKTARSIRQQADICLLVSGMMYWQTMILREALSILPKGTILLFNHGDQKLYSGLLRSLGNTDKQKILRLPMIPNPFQSDPSCEAFFDTLMPLLTLD